MPEFFTNSSISEVAWELALQSQDVQAKPLAPDAKFWLGLDSRGQAGAYYGTPDEARHLVVAHGSGLPTELAQLVPLVQAVKTRVHFNTMDERLGSPGGPGATHWSVWRSHAPRLVFQGRHVGTFPTRGGSSTCDIYSLPDGRVIANESVFPRGLITWEPRRVPLEANNFTFSSQRHMALLLTDHPDSAAIQKAVVGFGLLVSRPVMAHTGLRARPARAQHLRACA